MPINSSTDLGARIRQVRDRVPRHEFARDLSIGTSTLQRYESGERRPDSELLRRLCETYNVNPIWLLLGSGPMRLDEEVREGSAAYRGGSSGVSLKQAAQELLEASRELSFEPPVVWSTLIQELMAVHGLSPAGARRLLETVAALESTSHAQED